MFPRIAATIYLPERGISNTIIDPTWGRKRTNRELLHWSDNFDNFVN